MGNFTADALRKQMNVDIAFQNTGGVRANLDLGDITTKEIFNILPFNNAAVTYNMSVADIKNFLRGSRAGLYYSGVSIKIKNSDIEITDLNGNVIPDATVLKVGVNDYIPAVYDSYFPTTKIVSSQTDAATVISFLKEKNNRVNYAGSQNYFKF